MPQKHTLQNIVSICKRKGFIFPSGDIVGGIANGYDYGPLGTLLKKNIADSWWHRFVTSQENVQGLDSAVIQPNQVWENSGHLSNFVDPLVDCKKCKKRFRADHLIEQMPNETEETIQGILTCNSTTEQENWLKRKPCPCNKIKEWGEEMSPIRSFNLMFETNLGPLKDAASSAYLRPETAQGAFTNFENVISSSTTKVPFGLAQIGKAFRNEVTPGNFTFRTREFEQMELEWFCEEKDSADWYNYWMNEAQDWLYNTIRLDPTSIRHAEHSAEKLSHYSVRTTDFEYNFPSLGWGELWGFANRSDFDLNCHNVKYRDPRNPKNLYVPHVIEPSVGLGRLVLAVLCNAYEVENLEKKEEQATEEKGSKSESRTLMRFSPEIAPYTVAILPLVGKNQDQISVCRDLFRKIASNRLGTTPFFEISSGSIGKRYRRNDEIGTPYCVTVDFDTLEDQTVTLRDRDSMKQVRVDLETVAQSSPVELEKLF